jgi:hypothetical protein
MGGNGEQTGEDAGGLEVRLLTQEDDAPWDMGLRESNEGTWLQWLPWLRCAASRLGQCEVVGLIRAGRVIGGVAGMVGPGDGGSVFHNIPVTAYHGLWLLDRGLSPARHDSLLQSAAGALVPFFNARYAHWAFSSAPELIDPRPWRNLGCATDVYMTYRIPVESPDAVAARFDSAARRWVRKAEKAGTAFHVSAAGEQDLRDFEDNARETAERHGLIGATYPAGLFRDIAAMAIAEGRAKMFLARMADGRAASSVLITWDAHRAYTFLGGNASDGMSNGEPRFLDHHVFRWIAGQGHREIDLLGANEPHLHAYKKQFNGLPVPYLTVSDGRPPRLARGAHLKAAAKHLVAMLKG